MLTSIGWSTPPLYGAFHLLWIFLGIPAAVAAAWLLNRALSQNVRKAADRCGRRLLLILWGIMVAGEVYKQLFITFAENGGRYPFWYLPFQLCSMPLYLCLPAALCHPGKIKNALCAFLCGFSLLGGVMALVFPQDLLRADLGLTLHGFAWHILLVFLGSWLGFSGYGMMSGRHAFVGAAGLYFMLCMAALAINFALWEVSGHNIDMFYLGPMATGQPIFKQITQRLGWLGNLPIYMTCELLGGWLCWRLFRCKRQEAGDCEKV